MGARAIPARYERRLFFLDGLKRLGNVFHTLDASWVVFRPNEDEVVVHDREAFHSVTLGYELFFRRFGVDKNDIRIATSGSIESLTRALSNNLYLDSSLGFKQRQDVPKQSRILRRSSRRNDDRFIL